MVIKIWHIKTCGIQLKPYLESNLHMSKRIKVKYQLAKQKHLFNVKLGRIEKEELVRN